MAEILLTEAALQDADWLFDFLARHDPDAAAKAGSAIGSSISQLERFPESVQPYSDDFRIMTVPFGKRGYSIAYVYEVDTDMVIILGIKHQSEEYFPFEMERPVAECEES